MIRLLASALVGLVDAAAAFALGGVLCGLVVCAAAGWVCAQHDSLYQRAHAKRPPSPRP